MIRMSKKNDPSNQTAPTPLSADTHWFVSDASAYTINDINIKAALAPIADSKKQTVV